MHSRQGEFPVLQSVSHLTAWPCMCCRVFSVTPAFRLSAPPATAVDVPDGLCHVAPYPLNDMVLGKSSAIDFRGNPYYFFVQGAAVAERAFTCSERMI